MTEERLSLGRMGEELAADYLQRQGMKILERNYRAPVGEIDIIAKSKGYLVFAEVKTRRGVAFGLPQEAVGLRKQGQIIRCAQWYMQNFKIGRLQPRFDVLAVLFNDEESCQVQHFEHAFELS